MAVVTKATPDRSVGKCLSEYQQRQAILHFCSSKLKYTQLACAHAIVWTNAKSALANRSGTARSLRFRKVEDDARKIDCVNAEKRDCFTPPSTVLSGWAADDQAAGQPGELFLVSRYARAPSASLSKLDW
jgi:hypothetical protein